MFRDLYFRVKNKVEENVNKHYRTHPVIAASGKTPDSYWETIEDGSSEPIFFSLMNDLSGSSLIPKKIISDGFV